MRNRILLLPLIAGALLGSALGPAYAQTIYSPPSTANGCGRTAPAQLAPIYSSHYAVEYPPNAHLNGFSGHVFLRVLVDKYGAAKDVVVVSSSGHTLLDDAASAAIKASWRWEPPPPECAESGVIMGTAFDWFIGEQGPDRIYLDSPAYPPQARARKEGGTGEVQLTIVPGNQASDVKVISSTGSPVLDEAMADFARHTKFRSEGTLSAPVTRTRRFQFVPRNDPDTFAILMGPADKPSLPYTFSKAAKFTFVQPYPAPGIANGCGLNEPVFLEPELSTQFSPLYPVEAASSGRQGRTTMDVLVDKDGMASDVTVTKPSGLAAFDEAILQAVKGKWRWQAPPPECAGSGVHLRIHYDWFPGPWHMRFMPGDPQYPAAAIADKLSGAGVAQIVRAPDGALTSTKVLTSTNSPILDAAMIKTVTDLRFTPGTRQGHTTATLNYPMDFVGDPDALKTSAPLKRIAPILPPPSAANDCGRSATVYLAPIDSSHVLVPIPIVATKPKSLSEPVFSLRSQGALRMRLVVDRDGKPANVTITESSAPLDMELAVTETVKENYRWDPPPPECVDRGVALDLDYVYTWAAPQLQIYADDPKYPDAARQRTMGASGVVAITYRGDQIYGSKILVSSNSPELDDRMIKLVTDQVLTEIKTETGIDFRIQAFPIMFMPAFVASPKQQAAKLAAGPGP